MNVKVCAWACIVRELSQNCERALTISRHGMHVQTPYGLCASIYAPWMHVQTPFGHYNSVPLYMRHGCTCGRPRGMR